MNRWTGYSYNRLWIEKIIFIDGKSID